MILSEDDLSSIEIPSEIILRDSLRDVPILIYSLRIGGNPQKHNEEQANPQRYSLRIGKSLKESLRIISEGISIDVLELSSEKRMVGAIKAGV